MVIDRGCPFECFTLLVPSLPVVARHWVWKCSAMHAMPLCSYAMLCYTYTTHTHAHTSTYLHNGWIFYQEPIDVIIGWTVSVPMDVLVVDVCMARS